MSDGITLSCPGCGEHKAIQKEYDFLPVKLKLHSLKHTDDWYDSKLPIYTCKNCKREWAIERVNK